MRQKKATVEISLKDKINKKIDEVIEYIIGKDTKDITYNEYRILDSKLSSIKWEEEQAAKSKEMAELWSKTLGNNIFSGFGGTTSYLPDPVKED